MNLHFIWVIIAILLAVVSTSGTIIVAADTNTNEVIPFQQNYQILYGQDHTDVFGKNNSTIDISLDAYSGSGFGSIRKFASGSFVLKIKSSSKDTSCIITSFYLTSGAYDPHDEIDFEFYGSKSHPYELQTNVFANGLGCREQKVALWFDPTADFHTYEILWNQNQIVFSVDTIPIRVFKNNTGLGVDYPWRPMQVQATIWEADWACKKGKPDLSQGRFVASYQNFGIAGCPTYDENDPNSREQCYSPNLWWNSPNYCYLSPNENQNYKNIRDRHLTYDYCLDKLRYPVPPPECQANLPY